MKNKRFVLPFALPIASFALAIAAGSLLLWFDAKGGTYWDGLFMATSAVCVTGLSSVDVVTTYSFFGQVVLMTLMQLGGLGITTYSTLVFFLLSRRVALSDRIAVGQLLLNDSSFHLGFFIRRIVKIVLALEFLGAALLYLMEPERIGVFPAVFLAVSAFCNCGFALWSDNLLSWQQHAGVNLVVMSLIVLGGLGFAVLDECLLGARRRAAGLFLRLRGQSAPPAPPLSYLARLVMRTSFGLIVAGALLIFLTEYFVNGEDFFEAEKLILPAFFQSVTARTAGFNTVNIGKLTDIALLVLIVLMFIGGSSGSCAGGIKTGTFRILAGLAKASLRGKSQISVAGKGVAPGAVNKAMMLFMCAVGAITAGTFALALTESWGGVHGSTSFQVLDLCFEAVSAFGTVGLSTGVTPELSDPGKVIVSLLMYVGRLGPIWFITALQQAQRDDAYKLPEIDFPVG